MIPDILFSHAAMQLKSHAVCEPILSVFLYVSHIAFQTKEEIWAKTMDPFFQGEPSWGDLLQDFRSQELRVRHRFSDVVHPAMARSVGGNWERFSAGKRGTFRGANASNCGGNCIFQWHSQDGKITYMETDNTGDTDLQARACLRGRAMRRWINSPDRLQYPMKRVGKRGEGKFEQISWDEAIDIIADQLKYTIETYGNEAIHVIYATGMY